MIVAFRVVKLDRYGGDVSVAESSGRIICKEWVSGTSSKLTNKEDDTQRDKDRRNCDPEYQAVRFFSIQLYLGLGVAR